MRQETIEKCQEIEKLINGGMSTEKAISKVGVAQSSWWRFKALTKETAATEVPKKKRKYTKRQPTFVDIPTQTDSKVGFIVCSVTDASKLIKEFLQ